MSYQLIDRFTDKVVGLFGSQDQAEKALTRLYTEPGEDRYEIKAPKRTRTRTKKTNVKKESD